MISLLDTFLENPVDNPLANKPILEFFPTYAPTQFAAAGAFHHQVLASMAACPWPGQPPSPCSGWRSCAAAASARPQASSTSQQAPTAAGPGTPLTGPDSHHSTAPVTSPAPRPGHRGPSQPSAPAEPAARPL